MKENKDNKERTEINKMAILTAECDRMFRVDKEQIELFKQVQKNSKCRKKANVTVSKIAKKIKLESIYEPNDKA